MIQKNQSHAYRRYSRTIAHEHLCIAHLALAAVQVFECPNNMGASGAYVGDFQGSRHQCTVAGQEVGVLHADRVTCKGDGNSDNQPPHTESEQTIDEPINDSMDK